MDDPEMIFQGALDNHVNLIKQFKGNMSFVSPYSLKHIAFRGLSSLLHSPVKMKFTSFSTVFQSDLEDEFVIL